MWALVRWPQAPHDAAPPTPLASSLNYYGAALPGPALAALGPPELWCFEDALVRFASAPYDLAPGGLSPAAHLCNHAVQARGGRGGEGGGSSRARPWACWAYGGGPRIHASCRLPAAFCYARLMRASAPPHSPPLLPPPATPSPSFLPSFLRPPLLQRLYSAHGPSGGHGGGGGGGLPPEGNMWSSAQLSEYLRGTAAAAAATTAAAASGAPPPPGPAPLDAAARVGADGDVDVWRDRLLPAAQRLMLQVTSPARGRGRRRGGGGRGFPFLPSVA